MIRRPRIHFILLLILLAQTSLQLLGCITPPKNIGPSVISQNELDLVTRVKRGKDYALSGRLDLAENQLRGALKISDKVSSVYNDLGFVLSGQDRNREAIVMLEQAMYLDPYNLSAYENLARALYADGQLDKALELFNKIIDLHFQLATSDRPPKNTLGAKQLAEIVRNMSVVYFVHGKIDEAICYSQLAVNYSNTAYDITRHARLLMSVNKTTQALGLLQSVINTQRGQINSEILLDYGIVLYVDGQYALADNALSRVLALPETKHAERQSARLVRLAVTDRLQKEDEVEEIFQTVIEENETFCKSEDADGKQLAIAKQFGPYWPQLVVDDVRTVVEHFCTHGLESVV